MSVSLLAEATGAAGGAVGGGIVGAFAAILVLNAMGADMEEPTGAQKAAALATQFAVIVGFAAAGILLARALAS